MELSYILSQVSALFTAPRTCSFELHLSSLPSLEVMHGFVLLATGDVRSAEQVRTSLWPSPFLVGFFRPPLPWSGTKGAGCNPNIQAATHTGFCLRAWLGLNHSLHFKWLAVNKKNKQCYWFLQPWDFSTWLPSENKGITSSVIPVLSCSFPS